MIHFSMRVQVVYLIVGVYCQNASALTAYDNGTELFSRDPVCTEYRAYQLLTASKLPDSLNYVAVPWAYLINTNQLDRVSLKKINGGFTVCQHIRYEKIIPLLIQMGINVLFTPHVDKQYKDICVLPFPHWPVNGSMPAAKKDLWYSFMGADTHRVRRKLFKMTHPHNALVVKRSKWHFYGTSQQINAAKQEYQEALSRSRFSLCPRGTGASTIRFWESLQAGAIPVLLADDMRLPDIKGIDWSACIVRIPENNVAHFTKVLSSISSEQEKLMRQQGLDAFSYLCSPEGFVRTIEDYYASR